MCIERNKSVPNIPEKIDKQDSEKERAKSEGPLKSVEKQSVISNGPVPDNSKYVHFLLKNVQLERGQKSL